MFKRIFLFALLTFSISAHSEDSLKCAHSAFGNELQNMGNGLFGVVANENPNIRIKVAYVFSAQGFLEVPLEGDGLPVLGNSFERLLSIPQFPGEFYVLNGVFNEKDKRFLLSLKPAEKKMSNYWRAERTGVWHSSFVLRDRVLSNINKMITDSYTEDDLSFQEESITISKSFDRFTSSKPSWFLKREQDLKQKAETLRSLENQIGTGPMQIGLTKIETALSTLRAKESALNQQGIWFFVPPVLTKDQISKIDNMLLSCRESGYFGSTTDSTVDRKIKNFKRAAYGQINEQILQATGQFEQSFGELNYKEFLPRVIYRNNF